MSLRSDYGPILAIGAGVFLLGMATKRKPRHLDDLSGETCEPSETAPHGYQCGQANGGWELREEHEKFTGYGPYINQAAMDQALEAVGFPAGNLQGFQHHANNAHGQNLRIDGEIDQATTFFLREAEQMLARGEWILPGAI